MPVFCHTLEYLRRYLPKPIPKADHIIVIGEDKITIFREPFHALFCIYHTLCVVDNKVVAEVKNGARFDDGILAVVCCHVFPSLLPLQVTRLHRGLSIGHFPDSVHSTFGLFHFGMPGGFCHPFWNTTCYCRVCLVYWTLATRIR